MVRAKLAPTTAINSMNMVDLSTPPDEPTHMPGEDVDAAKRRAAEKMNVTRSTKKHAHASFAREIKESLAGGRPPAINVSKSQTHMKARWHSAAKEVAYKLLDLRKERWKEYTIFEKSKVYNKLNAQYKFDPPIDPRQVEKYLAAHLRSSRAVWKSHWLKYGDDERHHKCPKEAWEKLIKWWPTKACIEESADMAWRRSLVHNSSKTGRKRLVEKVEEEVRLNIYCLYCSAI